MGFWEGRSLTSFSESEWEQLCDGCGQCCAHKLEDEDTGAVAITDVACRLLDTQSCRCTNYSERLTDVPECLSLSPEKVCDYHWLPETCAYRRVADGRALPYWHYLISGDRELVHQLGVSVKGQLVAENTIAEDEWEERVVRWV